MPTPHISAPEGAFARTVLMPGDPLRAQFIAQHCLTDVQQVTAVRGMLGYTGRFQGKLVSVMGSGMGIPSIGIYSHELFAVYGVENIIRIGSAGSFTPDLALRDLVVVSSAYSESTYAQLVTGDTSRLMYPSPALYQRIIDKAAALGISCKSAPTYSSDVFYRDEPYQNIAAHTGAQCVEMESFGLFANAKRLGKNAACLLTISDTFYATEALTSDERQTSLLSMIRLALETARDLA